MKCTRPSDFLCRFPVSHVFKWARSRGISTCRWHSSAIAETSRWKARALWHPTTTDIAGWSHLLSRLSKNSKSHEHHVVNSCKFCTDQKQAVEVTPIGCFQSGPCRLAGLCEWGIAKRAMHSVTSFCLALARTSEFWRRHSQVEDCRDWITMFPLDASWCPVCRVLSRHGLFGEDAVRASERDSPAVTSRSVD